MKWFYNLKIQKKLILACIIAILITTIIGFIGVKDLNSINNSYSNLFKNYGNSQGEIGLVGLNFERTRSAMRDLIIETDPNNFKKYEDIIKESDEEMNKYLSEYEKTCLTQEEKNGFADMVKKINTYKLERDKVVGLALQNKNGEAENLMRGKGIVDAMSECDSIVNTIIKRDIELGGKNSSELTKSVHNISNLLIILVIGTIVITLTLGVLLSKIISDPIIRITEAAKKLAEGDLTTRIEIDTEDEVGQLAQALNKASENIRQLIAGVMDSGNNVNSSSEELSAATEEIFSQMKTLNESVYEISKGTQNLGSNTEEVSASTEEMNTTTDMLSKKAETANSSVKEIKNRATSVKEKATKAVEENNAIYEKQSANIIKAIEDGKVVEQVKIMAESIGNIASQTNLLALNAAIEAARAGEQGKGFAVVADEIKKLAEQSAQSVKNIQEMVTKIQNAFDNLSQSGKDVLDFMVNKVKPDYVFLNDIGIQYEKDANFVSEMSTDIALATKQMSETIAQINNAMQSVSATVEESSLSSEKISDNISETTNAIEEISKSAQTQAELAEKLNELIHKFEI